MPKGVYPRTAEHRANTSAAKLKYYQEHPNIAKGWHNTPEAKARKKAAHNTPEALTANRNAHSTSEARANMKAAQKRHRREHPEQGVNHSAALKKSLNTPEEYALIRQYGSPLINQLRQKYHTLNRRCNNPNDGGYKNYGGRGIRNLFTSRLHFLNYIINELHITSFEQIDGLAIDRFPDNDSHYMPGNIRFVTQQVNNRNKSIHYRT